MVTAAATIRVLIHREDETLPEILKKFCFLKNDYLIKVNSLNSVQVLSTRLEKNPGISRTGTIYQALSRAGCFFEIPGFSRSVGTLSNE